MANDYVTEKMDQEIAEIELIRSLHRWHQVGLGDEHLLDVLIAENPHIVLNMATRIAHLQTEGRKAVVGQATANSK